MNSVYKLNKQDDNIWLWHTPFPVWNWERLRARGEGDDRGWNGWVASLTQWTWVWASSGRRWGMEARRVAADGVAKSQTRLSEWTRATSEPGEIKALLRPYDVDRVGLHRGGKRGLEMAGRVRWWVRGNLQRLEDPRDLAQGPGEAEQVLFLQVPGLCGSQERTTPPSRWGMIQHTPAPATPQGTVPGTVPGPRPSAAWSFDVFSSLWCFPSPEVPVLGWEALCPPASILEERQEESLHSWASLGRVESLERGRWRTTGWRFIGGTPVQGRSGQKGGWPQCLTIESSGGPTGRLLCGWEGPQSFSKLRTRLDLCNLTLTGRCCGPSSGKGIIFRGNLCQWEADCEPGPGRPVGGHRSTQNIAEVTFSWIHWKMMDGSMEVTVTWNQAGGNPGWKVMCARHMPGPSSPLRVC